MHSGISGNKPSPTALECGRPPRTDISQWVCHAVRTWGKGLLDRVVRIDARQDGAPGLAAKPHVALALARRTVNSAVDRDLASGCRLGKG